MKNTSHTEAIQITADAYWSADKPSIVRSLIRTAISKHRIIFPLVDGIILSMAVATIVILFEGSYSAFTFYHKALFISSSVAATLFSFYIFGLYDNVKSIRPSDLAYRFAKVFIIASAMNLIICMLLGVEDYLEFTILLFGILGWCICIRQLMIYIFLPKPLAKRMMIVCNSDETVHIAEALATTDFPIYDLVGCVLSDGARVKPPENIPFYRGGSYIRAAEEMKATIIALTDDLSETSTFEINECVANGLKVKHLHNVYEKTIGRVPLSRATFLRGYQSVNRPLYVIAKRTMDLLVALVGNLCLLLILLPVTVAIKATSPGPLFYTQLRCGKNGRVFKLYKFRTMVEDAENSGARLTTTNDPRITPIGRHLRRMYIDEIPQFFNLLRGDLSLIGPRPERPEIIHRFKDDIPFFEYRHLIKPGITGWAQVNAPYAQTLEVLKEKIQYDFFYIKNRCFFLDLVILVKTAKSIVQMRGL